MDQVHSQPPLAANLLICTQHFEAKHRVECSECDRQFKNEESLNQVRVLFPTERHPLMHQLPSTMRRNIVLNVPSVTANLRKRKI